MGVDTSIGVGVGIVIDEPTWQKYVDTLDEDTRDNYADEEIFEQLLESYDLLSYDVGGSYYDNSEMTYVIAVSRLSNSYDTRDIPGGVLTQAVEEPITDAEREQLEAIADELDWRGKLQSYVSVLWH